MRSSSGVPQCTRSALPPPPFPSLHPRLLAFTKQRPAAAVGSAPAAKGGDNTSVPPAAMAEGLPPLLG